MNTFAHLIMMGNESALPPTADIGSNVWTLDKRIIEWFYKQGEWGVFGLIAISMLLTILLVGIIGFEREYRGHNAGLRTHVLVALGSCIIMTLSMYSLGYGDHMETMRLASTVATGIGFLGAGVIIQTGTTVKGLTTAATLWMSMSIGLACGSGNWTIALLGTTLAVICLICFVPLEKFANRKNPIILISIPETTNPVRTILTIATRHGITISSFESNITSYEGKDAIRMAFRINKTKKAELDSFINDLSSEIKYFEIKVA